MKYINQKHQFLQHKTNSKHSKLNTLSDYKVGLKTSFSLKTGLETQNLYIKLRQSLKTVLKLSLNVLKLT